MRQKSHATDLSSEEVVKGIRRATRKRYSAEEKIRIVLDGLRGEHSIAELCRAKALSRPYYTVERVPGGRQAAARRRYRACCDQRRGQGSQTSGPGAERGRC